MFLNLLQVVFHLHHNSLHLGMIRFRASGVDFSAHLLSNEPQFLALTLIAFECLEEVVEMIAQPYLLLGDVEFLNIENELLL